MVDEQPPEPDPASSALDSSPSSDLAPSLSKGLSKDPPEEPRRSRRSALLWVLEEVVWLSVVFLGAIAVGLAAAALGLSATAAVLFAFHAGLLVYSSVRERAKLAGWFQPSRAALIWGIGIGIAMTLTGALYASLLQLADIEIPDVATELRAIVPSRFLLLAWGAFFVPIAEELYFRGRLIDAGRRYFTTRVAVALAALAFAVVHGVPVLIPAYVALAWLLWIARDRTGGLLAPVIAHAINNLLGLIAE